VTDAVGFAGLPELGGTELSDAVFIAKQIIMHVRTLTHVKVTAVYPGNYNPTPTFVDVTPVIDQVNSEGTRQQHGTIYRIAVPRIHNGSSAILMDPVVGDVGPMWVSDRDHSQMIANNGGRSAPGSGRIMSLADGLFMGSLFAQNPTNYTDLRNGNHNSTSTKVVSHNVSGPDAKIADTATSGSTTNTRTNDPNAKSIVDQSSTGSNDATHTVDSTTPKVQSMATDGVHTSSIDVTPTAVSIGGALATAAGGIGSSSGGGGTANLAPSDGTTTPTAAQIGGRVSSGLQTVTATGAWQTVASIPLTAGYWLIFANISVFAGGGGATMIEFDAVISTTSGSPLSISGEVGIAFQDISIVMAAGDGWQSPLGVTTLTIATSETLYLNVFAGASAGTLSAEGIITAIRMG